MTVLTVTLDGMKMLGSKIALFCVSTFSTVESFAALSMLAQFGLNLDSTQRSAARTCCGGTFAGFTLVGTN
jgi:hypothetical protein